MQEGGRGNPRPGTWLGGPRVLVPLGLIEVCTPGLSVAESAEYDSVC